MQTLAGLKIASWAEDRLDRKSNSGFIFFYGGVLTWCCRKQDCVTLSTAEAEFVALSEAWLGRPKFLALRDECKLV
ncbi:hypothetical protein PPYR_00087 [Photinus pyralis]|uniref:Uncharacterized protein n=1 Tax=Photinus pyralis TaxID=7054 RepID=A0A5N4B0J3_PHOPY|nr:hypothetical protein PPYR_00087 [Photinus pyralis]